MRTITINICKFSELNESAQESAIANVRATTEYFFMEEVKTSIEKFCEYFPVNVSDWNWGPCGCYTLHSMTTDDTAIDELTGPRLVAYLVNNFGHLLTHRREYELKSGKRFVSRVLSEETSCLLTGVCYDETLLDPVRNFINKPDRVTTFKDLMGLCIDNVTQGIRDEIEYTDSDEAIKEQIEANDYEFKECGELV